VIPPGSRYAAVGTTSHVRADGTMIVHLRRRFVPPEDRFQTIEEHTVVEGERPDTLAARFLGDPEQWWRLADANGALRPEAMTDTPGHVVRITLPEGMTGGPGA
jgi:hypothetical protein